MMVEELEPVVLTEDLPEYQLKAGDVGMVLHVYPGDAGYEVEFVSLTGELIALVALHAHQVRRIDTHEIASARRVKSA